MADTTLGYQLMRLLTEYRVASTEPFASHPLGAFVRRDMADEVEKLIPASLIVKGSVGNGNWAETPWIAIFDPRITTSAQKGVYVVFLFDSAGRHVYLSLNQATTEVREEFGARFKDVLKSRAEFAQELLRPHGIDDLKLSALELDGTGSLTRGYCVGNIAAFSYPADNIPSGVELRKDLGRLINLYWTYVSVRSGEMGEAEELPEGVTKGQEAQKFRWHRRAERNKKLAADAKKHHGSTCLICGFNFGAFYGQRGEGYIEAHHVVPFAELAKELEPVTLDPSTDFIVVCSNCHRMLHRSNPPITPEQLRAMLV